MATAYWYMGNADTAIAEFNKALTYAPTNPNTLFNLGLVKWQGKHDSAGAIAAWKKLLAANPAYESRDVSTVVIRPVDGSSSADESRATDPDSAESTTRARRCISVSRQERRLRHRQSR